MTTESQRPWQDVHAEIRKTLRKEQYDTWFRRVRFSSPGGEDVLLVVPNRFYADWLSSNYRETVERAVKQVLGFQPQVAFEVDPSVGETPMESAVETPEEPEVPARPMRRLEDFVVGACNRLAQAAARSVAESPGAVYNPLFIHGGGGAGKSHLLEGICRRFSEYHPNERAACVPASEFVAQLVQAHASRGLERFRQRYCTLSLLALDDVGELASRESSQVEFFHIFNELHGQKRQVVVTGAGAPQELAGLSERLTSRLAWGLSVHLDAPDGETRLGILRKKASERRLRVPEDVLGFIATKVETNGRRLESALMRLAAYASLEGRELTTALAREVLAETDDRPRVINVPQVLEAVARHFGVKHRDMVSKKRARSIAFPRQVGMYLARQLTNASLGEIGRHFGGRDHTTVLYACEKIESQRKNDASLAAVIEEIMTGLVAQIAPAKV